MKLPFLLNSIARASSESDVERVFSQLLRVLPQLEGAQVSNALNLLSKKEAKPPQHCWNHASRLLLGTATPNESKNYPIPEHSTHTYGAIGHVDNRKRNHYGAMTTRPANRHHKTGLTYTDARSTDFAGVQGAGSVLFSYDIRDAIIILNAFSKVDMMPPELMRIAVEIVMRCVNKLDPHELSTVIHTLGKHGNLDDVGALLRKHKEVLAKDISDDRDYSMILRVLLMNRDKLQESHAFEELIGMIDSKCDAMSDKSMAILVNSLGRHGSDERGITIFITPLIIKRLNNGSFDAISISQIANGVARLNHFDHELMTAIARRTCDDLLQFNTRCKVTLLNAFHKLDHFNQELFTLLVTNLTSYHDDMTPQCIANTVAAVAHFSQRIQKADVFSLFQVLSHKIAQTHSLQQFTMQNQVNILNGLSKVGFNDNRVFEIIGDNIMQRTHQLKPIDAACTLNAFARVGIKHAVTTYICEGIETFISGMKPQELTCCINSINNLRKRQCTHEKQTNHSAYMPAQKVMANYLTTHTHIISRFRTLDVRLTITGLAHCGIVDQPLYARLLSHLQANLRHASMWDLVAIFSALVKVGYVVDTALLDAIECSLKYISICKDRGTDDIKALRISVEHMGLRHTLSNKLEAYTQTKWR